MKKFIGFLLLPLLGISQSSEFKINGKVGQLNSPALVLLRYAQDEKPVTDSVVLQNGSFQLKGIISHPLKATLTLLHEGRTAARTRNVDNLVIYLEKGTIRLASDDSLKNSIIKGSKINEENQILRAALKPTADRMKSLMDWFGSLTSDQKKDKAINDDLSAKLKENNAEQSRINKEFILSNPASWVSLETLKNYGGYYPEYGEVLPMFNSLSDVLKQSEEGMIYSQRLDKIKQTSVGATAPEFIQNDVKGNAISLASFRGKYVLVDFWASWCGPCRAENPNVVKTYQQYKDKNFTILGVSLDQPGARDKWIKAISDDHLEWTQVSDLQYWDNTIAKQYGIIAIPQNFLIDPSGKIVGKNLRSEGLKNKLAELIK